jgi:hypothetical protein
MNPEIFEQLIAPGWEQRTVEAKSGHQFDRQSWLTHTVIKACIGLANNPGGGYVLIGVSEVEDRLQATGFPTTEARLSWTHDQLADLLRHYADPTPEFEMMPVTVSSVECVSVRVFEFSEQPIICVRNSPQVPNPTGRPEVVLKLASMYVRGRGRAETRPPQDASEVRTLLDLARRKALQRFVQEAQGAGLQLGAQQDKSKECFQRELDSVSSNPTPTLEMIRHPQRARWRVVIFPSRYQPDRAPIRGVEDVVRQAGVQRGMPIFPHYLDEDIVRHQNRISAATDFPISDWHLFRSGLFVCWTEARSFNSQQLYDREIGIAEIIRECTMAFQFAANLSLSPLGDSSVTVSIGLDGAEGLELTARGSPMVIWPRIFPAICRTKNIDVEREMTREALAADFPAHAMSVAEEIFYFFRQKPIPSEVIKMLQDRFLQ